MNNVANQGLEEKSSEIRKKVIEMMVRANQGHPGSVFSMVEIAVFLYYGKVSSLSNPVSKKERDKLVISKGHATHVVYPILEDLGYIPKGSCDQFGTAQHNIGPLRMFGNIKINGVDATTGSLGHGIGIGSGYALADKLDGKKHLTYVVISEGEMYEGSIWEAALFSAHHQLNNLVVILDRNRNMILGDTESCVRLEPVDKKWESFGWNVLSINGHDFQELNQAFTVAKRSTKPTCIIASTIKGKGNKVMENAPEWHYWHSNRVQELLKG
jgi:transketolase